MTNDAALVTRMRRGEHEAWIEYVSRFHPILEAYARKARIDRIDWPACVSEVLEDGALRLISPDVEVPANIAAYLIRAAHRKHLRIRQASAGRGRRYEQASDERCGERFVASACSEDALRMSAGVDDAPSMSAALRRLAEELGAGLSPEESAIMVWVSEQIPHREIARWLSMSYDACTKRIWRLCNRLRTEAGARAAHYPEPERREIDRFLRRAARVVQAAPGDPSSAHEALANPCEHGRDPRRTIQVSRGS